MAEPKTKATKQSVVEFLNTIEPEEKRNDAFILLKMYEEVTGEKAVMWGPSIVGFGMYHYTSERSSQEGDWPRAAFSPRKHNLTLYVMQGNENSQNLLKKLGKHKTSKGCLYINKLSDVDITVLPALIKKSLDHTNKLYK